MFQQAAVIGAGLMGRGISRHLSSAGVTVTLFDTDKGQLDRAASELPDSVRLTGSLADIANCDYVIEAVFEDLEVKRSAMADVESVVDPMCVIATNTSSLLVRDIAQNLKAPSRFLGVHYNNPADMNPVVEVIATAETKPGLAAEVAAWLRRTDKIAITCADTSGFILNRQSLPYLNEAARCVAIASPFEIDRVATSRLGVGLGPFAVMNLVGTPVMAAASRNLSVLGRGYAAAEALQQISAATPNTWQIETHAGESEATSVEDQIYERLLGAMMFPGKDILDQQLCRSEDLHEICKTALGYERSSPELLTQMSASESDRLINIYLQEQ